MKVSNNSACGKIKGLSEGANNSHVKLSLLNVS